MLLLCIMLTGCASNGDYNSSGKTESCSRDIFAMDTYMSITCYGENAAEAADEAEEEIRRLDSLLSTGIPESEISRLNSSGSANLSPDPKIICEKALELASETDGAFDITIYPVMELWGFTTREYSVPDSSVLSETLKNVGSDLIKYHDGNITLLPGMGIDLGGIAKGYTSDRISDIFAKYNLTSGLISLGGNVCLYGTKPDGSLWRCGIRDPRDPDSAQALMGVLETSGCSIITSGAYERYFTGEDGRIYHHIIDPGTGFPADSGLISATIVSESGMLADGLSTAVYVMGLDKATEFWRSGCEEFEMILMTDADEVFVTEGLKDSFSTEYPLHVISR